MRFFTLRLLIGGRRELELRHDGEAPLPCLTAAKNNPVIHTGSCGFLRVNRKGCAARKWGSSVG